MLSSRNLDTYFFAKKNMNIIGDLSIMTTDQVDASFVNGGNDSVVIGDHVGVGHKLFSSEERNRCESSEVVSVLFQDDHAGLPVVGDHLGDGVPDRELLFKVHRRVGGVVVGVALRANVEPFDGHADDAPIALDSDLHVGTWIMRGRSFPTANQFLPRKSFGDLGETQELNVRGKAMSNFNRFHCEDRRNPGASRQQQT